MKLAPPEPRSIEVFPLSLRADVRPDSIDEDARTVEVVFSTGAGVMRHDWRSDTKYIETLSLKPSAVRLERLNSGAPFLNTHSNVDLGSVLGVVEPGTAKVTGTRGLATIRFSRREDVEPIWQDVRDRIVRNVSVGYRVHKYEITAAAEGTPETRLGTDWEPYEISACPMPADMGAQVRAAHTVQTNPCVIVTREMKETSMPDEPTVPTQPQLMDPVAPLPIPEAQRAPATTPNEHDLGADDERKRITGILRACQAARLPMATAEKLIADGVPLLEAQSQIFESLRVSGADQLGPKSGPSGIQVAGADPLENVWRGISNALLHKAAPQYFKLEDIGRPYRSRSLLAAAELCLHHRGVRTTELTKMELAGAAFGLSTRAGGMHSTSDFANILADAQNKILRASYGEAPQTFAPIARRIPVSDFKTVNLTQLGDAPALLEVKEHGEFQRGTVGDSKETFALSTWGRIFSITRKALVNDDLDAFSRLPVAFGRQARNKESDLIWAQINANGLMADGVALFSTAATRLNLASSGAAIDVTTLGAGRAAMRIQKGLDGVTPLNLVPRYLIVPVGKETLAQQYTMLIAPVQGSTVNPFSGRLDVITEPRLDANSLISWYLAASTEQTDIVVYGFLDGEDGPVVESRVGFDVDGLEIKCRHDVAAKVVDFRGLWKNPGA